MRQNGRSIGRWSLVLWLLLCWFLALAVSGSSPVTATNSGMSQLNLKLRLLKLEVKLQILETAWAERTISWKKAKQLSAELQHELNELKLSLANSQTSLMSSQEEVARSETLSLTLQTRLDNLLMTFDEYQKESERQIRRQAIELWIDRAGLVVLTVLLIITAMK